MEDCREVTCCRACGGPLEAVLDLGSQCLAGRFPKADEPDPPAFPLVLVRCTAGCGLVQLGHTVNPELMFRDYWYQSGVTATMKSHLCQIADEAAHTLGRTPSSALDIGCNDGTLLARLASRTGCLCVGVDPCDVALCEEAEGPVQRVQMFWPPENFSLAEFDLIFSVACFYDADDPLTFARAVREYLAPDGLWVVEVASLWAMCSMNKLNYDGIVHEHLCYYNPGTLEYVLAKAGFQVVRTGFSEMNGGSFRLFCKKAEPQDNPTRFGLGPKETWTILARFAVAVKSHREKLRSYLVDCRDRGLEVHLLGASTKANTVLQYAGIDKSFIQAAADRDPRKAGRVCPGTRIPILTEEQSRDLAPNVYLTVLGHFKKELLERERHFLLNGGKVVFVLPGLEEVKG